MSVELLKDPNDSDNKDINGGPAVGGVPEVPAVPPAGQAGQSPIAQTAAPQARGRTGSGFQNLQTVLAANRNNRLGQAVGSGIQNISGQVKQASTEGFKQFQSEAEKARIGGAEDVAKRQSVINRITGYQAPQSLVDQNQVTTQVLADPNQVPQAYVPGQAPVAQQAVPSPISNLPSVSDEEAKEFAKFREGQYTGPQGLKDYESLSDQASRAEGLGQLTRSMGGQQELLREFVNKRPDYSRGKRTLDALLLGQTGAKELQDARASSRGIVDQLQNSQRTAEKIAAMQADLSSQFGKETRDQLGETGTSKETGSGALGDISKSLYGDLDGLQERSGKEFKDFQTRLATKQLTLEDIEKYIKPLIDTTDLSTETSTLGLTPEQFASAYEQGKYDLSSVADPTRLAKIQALQKLSGATGAMGIDPAKLGQQSSAVTLGGGAAQFKDYANTQKELEDMLSNYEQIEAQAQLRSGDFQKQLDDPNFGKYKEFDPLEHQAEIQRRIDLDGYTQEVAENVVKEEYNATKQREIREQLVNQQYLESSVPRNQARHLIDALKKKYGANESITSLMNPEQRAAYEQKYKSRVDLNKQAPLDQAQYQNLIQKYLKGNVEDLELAPGKTLTGMLGRDEAAELLMTGGFSDSALARARYDEAHREGSSNLWNDRTRGASEAIRNVFSDKRVKKNIKPASKKIQKFLDNLKPYSYDYKNEEHGEGKQLGIMAQDLEKSDIGKSAVIETPQGKQVNYGKLAGTLLASNVQLNERIKKLEKGRKK